MKTNKQLKDTTFQELVDEATADIHMSLLEGGGKGMKASVHKWMSTIAQWRDVKNDDKSS